MIIKIDSWSFFHCLGCQFIFFYCIKRRFTAAIAFFVAAGSGLLWEVTDWFKPNWSEGLLKPFWIQWLFYSDGFSWSDIFFDLLGITTGIFGFYLITRKERS